MAHHTSPSSSGEPRDFAIVAGVRKIPSAIDSPVTAEMAAARPSCLGWVMELRRSRSKLRDHLDDPHDMPVELGELLRGDPQLLVHGAADRLDRIPGDESGLDPEPGHEPGAALLDVPVPRDLRRV